MEELYGYLTLLTRSRSIFCCTLHLFKSLAEYHSMPFSCFLYLATDDGNPWALHRLLIQSATDLKLFCTLKQDSHGTKAVSKVCDDLLLLSLAILCSPLDGEMGGNTEPLVNLWGCAEVGTEVTPWWYCDNSSWSCWLNACNSLILRMCDLVCNIDSGKWQ